MNWYIKLSQSKNLYNKNVTYEVPSEEIANELVESGHNSGFYNIYANGKFITLETMPLVKSFIFGSSKYHNFFNELFNYNSSLETWLESIKTKVNTYKKSIKGIVPDATRAIFKGINDIALNAPTQLQNFLTGIA